MQTVDTCMQYWRQKIIKIRGQSLSSRFFRLIIPIPDSPPLLPMPSHSGQFGPCCPLLKEFSLTVNCCRVSLHLCTCRGGGHSGDVVFLQYTLYKYGIFHWKSMQVNTTQVCKYAQVHKCTKNTSMCRSEHSSMQRSSPTDWPGPAFAALSPGDHLPLRPTTQSHHNIINKRMCTSIFINIFLSYH